MTTSTTRKRVPIPRDKNNDYTRDAAELRRAFVEQRDRQARLEHVAHYSFAPDLLPGNIENFTGIAQVPLGLAGPLRIVPENTRAATFTFLSQPPRARWSRATTAACAC